MDNLICSLKKFNRKERFYLIGTALGNSEFYLDGDFRAELKSSLPNLDCDIPNNAFVAMDYHIDWIYASLLITQNPQIQFPVENKDSIIKATQEDIDLVVCFPDEQHCGKHHLILCECKAETGWTNKQLLSKAGRLVEIFGDDGKRYEEIVLVHFVLLSPKKSNRLRVNEVPSFMKTNGDIPWMQLHIPDGLQKITRCDKSGRDSINGVYWKVEKTGEG